MPYITAANDKPYARGTSPTFIPWLVRASFAMVGVGLSESLGGFCVHGIETYFTTADAIAIWNIAAATSSSLLDVALATLL